jgi:probable HAF family extracellular repeat protein
MRVCALAGLGALAGLAAPAQAVTYDCAPLSVGGSMPSASSSAINNKNQVAGSSTFQGTRRGEATLWKSPRKAINLGGALTMAYSSNAHGLNDRGQIVGEVRFDCNGLCGFPRPVSWQDGVPTELPLLDGQLMGRAYSVNHKGRIVGYGLSDRSVYHAVLWRDGQVIDLGTLGDKAKQAQTNSLALYVGADDIVVGTSGTGPGAFWSNAVRWDARGHITDLGVLPGGYGSTAWAVNRAGTIVGTNFVSDSYDRRAVAWQNGQIIELAPFTSGANSTAFAISDSGTIVGGESLGANTAALLWPGVNEPPVALKPLVANACLNGSDDDYSLDVAQGINASGAIVVNGWQQSVGSTAFLLTPR